MTEPSLSAADAALFALIANRNLPTVAFREQLDALLRQGASLLARDAEGNTPLMAEAGFAPRLGRVEALLGAGADPRGTNARGEGALHIAALADNAEAIGILVAAGAQPNTANVEGVAPLHRAAITGSAQAIFALARHGASLEALDDRGLTPLQWSAKGPWPQPAAVGAFLRLGADVRSTLGGEEITLWAAKRRVLGRVAALAGADGRDRLAHRGAQLLAELGPQKGALPLNFADISQTRDSGLHEAARHGDAEALAYFLAQGIDPRVPGADGLVPLHLAAGSRAPGAPAVIEALARVGAPLSDFGENVARRSPLMRAAERGLLANVNALLDAGAPLSVMRPGAGPKTALDAAIAAGAEDAVWLLLDRGASVATFAPGHDGPLTLAARHNRADIAQMLLDRGAPVDAPGQSGRTALSHAAANGNEALAATLLDAGAKAETLDTAGWSPLAWAAFSGELGMCRFLARRGAPIDPADSAGETPLSKFAGRGDVEGARLLLSLGADPNRPDAGGRAPLAHAALAGSEGCARLLLAHGANPVRVDVGGWTPMLLAAHTRGAEGVLAAMLDASLVLGPALSDGRTVLHLAVLEPLPRAAGDTPKPAAPAWLARKILDRGADPMAVDTYKSTPLHLAAGRASPELLGLLIERGANIEARDAGGFTPLMAAANAGSGRNVEALLRAGAAPDAQSKSLATPFRLAMCSLHGGEEPRLASAVAAQMALANAIEDVASRDDLHRTPLHWAAWGTRHEGPSALSTLLARGAPVDALDRDGDTPLTLAIHVAEAYGGPKDNSPLVLEPIATLLNAGANPSGHAENGRAPLVLAAAVSNREASPGSPWANAREELCALLLSRGARLDAFGARAALEKAGVDAASILERLGMAPAPKPLGAAPDARATPRPALRLAR